MGICGSFMTILLKLKALPHAFGTLEKTEITSHLPSKKIDMILIKTWEQALDEAYPIRQEVFIHEQGVPEAMELDEFDPSADHALAYKESKCVGTARLVYLDAKSAQIGRMAVLSAFRGRGIGMAMLMALVHRAQAQGISSVILHSQVMAMPFYEKQGFITQGPIYEEAGIPHRNMILLLPKIEK